MCAIKQACNYLLEAEELLKEEKGRFDYFKFPSIEVNHGEQNLQEFFMRIGAQRQGEKRYWNISVNYR